MVYVVVEYPNNCPNKFSLYDGNKKPSPKVGQHFERTFITVHKSEVNEILMKSDKSLTYGYPLKANIFFRFPTSITDCANLNSFIRYNSDLTNGYCGLDALIMHNVMEVFKFNATFEMQSTTNYGYVQSGQVTGTLGLIVRGEIDVSFNSRFIVLYSLENNFDFLYQIWDDSLCALMKEPNEVPLWHYPYNIYGITTWLFVLPCLTFVGSMMYVRNKLFRLRTLKFYIYPVNAVWSGLFGFFFNKKIKRSLLAALCLLCSVVFTAEYQGNVNNMFATLVRYDRFKTLQQLCDNGVAVYTSPSVAILLGRGAYLDNSKSYLVRNLKFFPDNQSATGQYQNKQQQAE
ncbi:uncharacterized protein LOC135309899 [Plodia interpunctella]|uniref:uncharacterized protein LOC135309899 n=1 Tax=Plodia interpunctella TaxID=58824 RepID=UPI0031017715